MFQLSATFPLIRRSMSSAVSASGVARDGSRASRAGRLWGLFVGRYTTPRMLGLDLLRIAAAVIIVFHHGNVERAVGVNWASAILWHKGYLAVDIFMVLSGWLLTRQALSILAASKSGFQFITTFWLRRWARTLPAYWVVLLILFVFFHEVTFATLLKHAAFLQTLFPPNAYDVTWSLVAEEWFYLALPFVVLICLRVQDRRVLACMAAVMLLVPATVRAVMLHVNGPDYSIQLVPQARFDGLLVGAMLAATSLKLKPLWAAAVHRRHVLAITGVALIAVIVAGPDSMSWAFLVPGLLAFGLGMACLMPLMTTLRWPSGAPRGMMIGVAFMSELTYAIYLTHMLTLNRIHWVTTHGLLRVLLFGASALLIFGCAALLHLVVERPFLALRDWALRSRALRPPRTVESEAAVIPGLVQEQAPASS